MIRFSTINIEGHRHLDRVLPFLQSQKIQVACLQEVFEDDVAELAKAMGADAIYTPMAKFTQVIPEGGTHSGRWGVAILSTFPFVRHESFTYVGSHKNIPIFEPGNPNSVNRAYLQADIQVDEKLLRVSTTHFTWTPDGSTSQEQLDNFAILDPILRKQKPHIFCGDLNSPRGWNGVFDILAKEYVDNIPPEATTSIDGSLHKAGNLQLMVDALFTRAEMKVEQAQLHTGVSDHQAVTALIDLT